MDMNAEISEKIRLWHEAFEKIGLRAELITKSLTLPVRDIESLTLPYRRITLLTQLLSEKMRLIVEGLSFLGEEDFQKFMQEFGWIECLSLAYVKELYLKFKENGKEEVWKQFAEYFKTSEVIKQLLGEMKKRKILLPRIGILETALHAHKDGKFVVSIPLLLSQIEGIMWDIGVKKGVIKNEFNSKTKLNSDGSEAGEIGIKACTELIFGFQSRFKKRYNDIVYSVEFRHPISHGRDFDYYRIQEAEAKSISLLLMLLVVMQKSEEVENSNIKLWWE